MHMHACLIFVEVNTSIQLTRQGHWARFAFPVVPGHEATFSNAVTLFLKQAFLSLSLGLYLRPEEAVRTEHTCRSDREHSQSSPLARC